METKDIIENEKPHNKYPKYNNVLEIFKDKKNLTISSPITIFFLFVIWVLFIWFLIATFSERDLGGIGGILIVLSIFSYSLFLSLKNKMTKK